MTGHVQIHWNIVRVLVMSIKFSCHVLSVRLNFHIDLITTGNEQLALCACVSLYIHTDLFRINLI